MTRKATKNKKKEKLQEAPAVDLNKDQEDLAEKLTRLQRRFVLFLVGSNMSQRQAYLAAGGKAKTESTQDASASEILSNPKVRAFYDSLMAEAQTDSVMSKAEALERLSKQARIKITDICTFKSVELETPNGMVRNTVWEMKDAEDIDPDVAACIKSVTFTKAGPKIELYDSNGTIKLMADMLGWNAAKTVDHKSSDGSMSPEKMTDEEIELRINKLLSEK